MAHQRSGLISAAWRLVIEQGYSRRSAARRLGLTEARVDRILNALHARRKRLAPPMMRRYGRPCAILLEDDPLAARTIEQMLADASTGMKIVHASSRAGFAEALDVENVDVVISDSSLADLKPLRALYLAKQRHPAAEFFILSGRKDPMREKLALRAGVGAWVEKKRISELMSLVRSAISRRVVPRSLDS